MLGPEQTQFLLDGRQEDEVARSLDAAAVEGAEHLQGRHQVRRVVANARRPQDVAFAFHLQVGALRENRVHVGGEHNRWTAAASFADAAHIKDVVGADLAQP